FKRDEIPIPGFEPKCAFGALQAADVLAWHVHYTVNEVIETQSLELTEYWESLSDLMSIPGWESHGIYFEKDLVGLCENVGTPRRDNTSKEISFHDKPKRVRRGNAIKRNFRPS
ncbi:MAG: hypothetical protein ACRDF4_09075, partial [Rhabdochlamydiaceae bacterium]